MGHPTSLSVAPPTPRPHSRKTVWFSQLRNWLLWLTLTFCALKCLKRTGLFVDPSAAALGEASGPVFIEFGWEQLSASTSFEWVNCFDVFQCAKFEVPLDYTDANGLKANIAVAKFPSKYAHSDTRYRGPIFYNPGGPGSSGVAFIRKFGPLVTGLLGNEYDHVGFDPRGVGASTPAPIIFSTETERRMWELPQYPTVDYTIDGIGQTLARSHILGSLALQRANVSARHVGTAEVAKDIMAMNRAHGREKIMYWGASYGTVLGITLAAMFPDKIERLVVDSLMDLTTYYETTWNKNLLNTDDALKWLFTSCSTSSSCPLHEKTPSGVRARYERIVDNLKRLPVPVIDGPTYGVVDWPMLRGIVFGSLYRPYLTFAPLAQALADLERNDGRALYALSGRDESTWQCDCAPRPPVGQALSEVNLAILCGDGEPVRDDHEALVRWYQDMAKTTSWADMMGVRIMCAGWKIYTKDRFAGPFVGNTSHPILFMGNTADPVGPLLAANQTSQGFPGSAVVAIDAPGHGSIVTPSLCGLKHLRTYVREGIMPPDAFTMCKTDVPIFPSDETSQTQLAALSDEDQWLYGISQELSSQVELRKLLGFRM